MSTEEYIKRFSKNGQLSCAKCKPPVKLRAIWLALYSIGGANIHQPFCADHSKKAPQDGLIRMEFIG